LNFECQAAPVDFGCAAVQVEKQKILRESGVRAGKATVKADPGGWNSSPMVKK